MGIGLGCGTLQCSGSMLAGIRKKRFVDPSTESWVRDVNPDVQDVENPNFHNVVGGAVNICLYQISSSAVLKSLVNMSNAP